MNTGEVSVFLVPVHDDDVDLEALTATERARAASMRRGRAGFVGVRGALRTLLGAALGLPPGEVLLHDPPGHKPRLVPGQGDDVRFSVSHTDGLGAVALAVGRDVGVDVERLSPRSAAAAGRVLGLGPAPDSELLAAWCAAEAVAKASSRGLPAVLRGPSDGGWLARPLSVPAGWSGAVAACGPDWSVVLREVPG